MFLDDRESQWYGKFYFLPCSAYSRIGWPGADVAVIESHIFESLGWWVRVVAGLIPNILHVGRKRTTLGALRVLTGWPNVMLLTHFGY